VNVPESVIGLESGIARPRCPAARVTVPESVTGPESAIAQPRCPADPVTVPDLGTDRAAQEEVVRSDRKRCPDVPVTGPESGIVPESVTDRPRCPAARVTVPESGIDLALEIDRADRVDPASAIVPADPALGIVKTGWRTACDR
jgi:hypothetical protein